MEESSIDKVLVQWFQESSISENIEVRHQVLAHPASYTPISEWVSNGYLRELNKQGIELLYAHQKKAVDLIRAGKNVVISTGTASGKTLCYNLPIIQELLENKRVCALYLFPTKALTQDQYAELTKTLGNLGSYKVSVYDGDTPAGMRKKARENANIILSNPDMLHAGILPVHTQWESFFRNLKYVVIDEIHIYRGVFGSHFANVIFFGVKEAPRGQSEPELANLAEIGVYKFKWKIAFDVLKKKTLWLIFIQGFFGVFPWNVITYWFFAYLETERHYDQSQIMFTMVFAVLVLAAGYPIGGAIGDYFFKRSPTGRLWVGTVGVLAGALFLTITMLIPIGNSILFGISLAVAAIFIPIASPNVLSTIYDITLPEVRSTTYAIESFIESIGAAAAPLIAGVIADQSSLRDAILIISVTAWIICAIFFAISTKFIPADINTLRKQMKERAELEKAH